MPAHLTEAEARALGITGVKGRRKRTTQIEADGPYHTRCSCGEEFTSTKAEDAHVAVGHNRFEVVLP